MIEIDQNLTAVIKFKKKNEIFKTELHCYNFIQKISLIVGRTYLVLMTII